jgi:hypothetical protein
MANNARKDALASAKWQDFDTNTLSGDIAKAYSHYQDKAKAASEAREKFEAALGAAMAAKGMVSKGEEAVFSHRFGRLSVAIVPAETSAKRGKIGF